MQNNIKSIHDSDLEGVLKKVNIWEDVNASKVKCHFCDKVITLDNLYAFFAQEQKICVVCNAPACVQELAKVDLETAAPLENSMSDTKLLMNNARTQENSLVQSANNDNLPPSNRCSKKEIPFTHKKIGIVISSVFIIIIFTIAIYSMHQMSQLRIKQERENERRQRILTAFNKQYQDYGTTFTEIIKKEQKNGFEQKYGKIISLDIKLKNLDIIKRDQPDTDILYAPTDVDIVLVYRTDEFESRPLTQKEKSSGKFIWDDDRKKEAALFSKKIIQGIIDNLMTNNIDPQTHRIIITTSIKAIISEKTVTGKDIITNVTAFQYYPDQDRIVGK